MAERDPRLLTDVQLDALRSHVDRWADKTEEVMLAHIDAMMEQMNVMDSIIAAARDFVKDHGDPVTQERFDRLRALLMDFDGVPNG